jgi:large subunit ribosomal protein L25
MSNQKNHLNAESRSKTGTIPSRQARRIGRIPAVIYGHGAEVRHVTIDKKEWNVLAKQDIHIVMIKIDDKETVNALIKSSDYDYLKGQPIHVDFQAVNMDEKITATIPVHGKGTPVGLSQGGVMEQAIHEIKLYCTPNNLPEVLEVDISNIGLNEIIHISDIVLPEGVEIAGDGSLPVFHVAEPNTGDSEDEKEEEVAE